MKLGILDIGTNSIHIVIADVKGEHDFEIVGRGKDMTRLGDETLKSGVLPAGKISDAVRVVKQFVQLAKNRGVQKLVAVATAAVREAANGGELVDRLYREAGVKVRPITGEEEARLIYLAVRHYCDLTSRRALIIDIGGGSAEFIVGSAQVVLVSRCLKLGSARLKDLFVTDQPVPKSDLKRLQRHIETSTESLVAELKSAGFEQVIATSGTALNLAAIVHERRTGEPLTNPTGFTITKAELEDVAKRLARSGRKELGQIPGIDPDRKDLLLPGALLLLHVLEETGRREILLCDKAIREGLILDYVQQNPRKLGAEEEIPNARRRAVLSLANRCEYDAGHAKTVARLCLALFDRLDPPGPLRANARELAEYAALVHDIGYHVSFEKHHKHAYYLVKNSDLPGFAPEEVEIMASAARYHRNRGPKKSDANLRWLGGKDRRTVEWISGLLRVADALDRSHFDVVQDVRPASGPRGLRLLVSARGDAAMELWAANQKKTLLEELLGRPVEILAAPKATVRTGRRGPG